MPTFVQWLPTIVAVITAAIALGSARSELAAVRADLAETRAEYKALTLHVQDVLTAKAVTATHVDTLRIAVGKLEAERAADTTVRHKFREEIHGMLARIDARVDDLLRVK